MSNISLDPNSFDQAYAVLKRNAEFLSQQQEPSIDQLVPLVEESMRAYQICQTRLAAIRQALDQQLPDQPRVEAPTPAAADAWPDEDGIPF